MTSDETRPPSNGIRLLVATAGLLGLLALPLCLWLLSRNQFNVANYTVQLSPKLPLFPSLVFVLGGLLITIAVVAVNRSLIGSRSPIVSLGGACLPLIICVPVAAYTRLAHHVPFVLSFIVIAAAGWTGWRLGSIVSIGRSSRSAYWIGLAVILSLVIALTLVHTGIQRNYYDHFMFGHADIGHYLEEMKNCLAGRGLRSDSFDFVRHGWHFVPLFHVVVPFFWLWPTETFWMVFGAFTMHATALIAYVFAKRVTGSVFCALCWGIAWLLLPSVGRMVFSNTYGFQWTCVAIPLLGLMIYFWYAERLWASAIMAGLVLLTQETNAASVVGWGLFLAIFTKRRIFGLAIAAVAVVYLIVCLKWIIPYYSHGIAYQRFDLFGSLGPTIADVIQSPFTNPREVWAKLSRGQVLFYLGMMLVPLAGLPLRGWRMAMASLPGLVLILLMQNPEYLSIKFWHHSTFLPFLFFAGMVVAAQKSGNVEETPDRENDLEVSPVRKQHAGRAGAILMAALFAHYFFGFSPVSRPYAVVAADSFMNSADPRLAVVEQLRRDIARSKTVLATERMAAHFWDYRRIYTGGLRPVDYIIIDRIDAWDRSGLPQAVDKILADPDYKKQMEAESIVVFQRRADATRAELGD